MDDENKIIIPVAYGNIVAERNPEKEYDGVSVYFQDFNGVITDLAIVEAKDEYDRKQIDLYVYGDISTEDYTDKVSIQIRDVLRG